MSKGECKVKAKAAPKRCCLREETILSSKHRAPNQQTQALLNVFMRQLEHIWEAQEFSIRLNPSGERSPRRSPLCAAWHGSRVGPSPHAPRCRSPHTSCRHTECRPFLTQTPPGQLPQIPHGPAAPDQGRKTTPARSPTGSDPAGPAPPAADPRSFRPAPGYPVSPAPGRAAA